MEREDPDTPDTAFEGADGALADGALANGALANGATQDGVAPDRDSAARLARLRRTAARLDTDPRWVSVARRVRERLPGDPQFGDPLSTAGRKPVEVIARGVTSLRGEPQSLVQEVGLGALQLWQSLSEATGRGRGEREMALLFTDLVGFSSWALEAGDEPVLELLRAVGTEAESAIVQRGGRLVKRLGDGLMATFLNADDAVLGALEAQEAVSHIELYGYRPRMRAGVHWGRPRKLGGDYLGIDVNVAARVAQAARGDQVLVSNAVLEKLNDGEIVVGKSRRLKAEGAPRELQVAAISRR